MKKKHESYLPLKADVSQIIVDLDGCQLLKWPDPIRTPTKRLKKSTFCRFYKGYGHTINNCWDLKNEIDYLTREGYLNKYLVNPISKGRKRGRQSRPSKQKKRSFSSSNESLSGDCRPQKSRLSSQDPLPRQAQPVGKRDGPRDGNLPV